MANGQQAISKRVRQTDDLEKPVCQILDHFAPQTVILFGSQACGA